VGTSSVNPIRTSSFPIGRFGGLLAGLHGRILARRSQQTPWRRMAMSTRAVSSFDVTGWDEAPYDQPEGGPHLSRATVLKTFRGDLEGNSTAQLLMCRSDPSDLAAGAGYIALETITGTLEGRAGSFVVQHGGLSEPGGTQPMTSFIVTGSGRGELAGIRGTVEIAVTAEGAHTLTLDYELA
jgi:hypothetical protein